MKARSARWAAGLLVLALLGSAAPTPVAAQSGSPTQEDYEDVVNRLEEARRLVREMERKEQGLRSRISSTAAQRRALEIELEELQALVGSAQSRLDAAEAVLAKIQDELDRKTEELQRTLQQLQEAHDLVRERAVRVYMNGPGSFLEFVLGAGDYRDLVNRLTLVGRVFRSDNARILSIRQLKAQVETEREEIATLREQAAEQVAGVKAERDRVASIRNAVEARRRNVSSELQSQYAALGGVQQQKERYIREQRELEEESRRIASFLRGRNGGTASAQPGEMVWPTSGPVTSGYGWRTHPIYGTRRFHAGIDIGAPTGRPVVAAASGTVIFTGWRGGYGNTVIVDHGGGLATLYAHLSSIGTGDGAFLSQGQRLGGVGCTGSCTGPHLHFEVRVNGEPQNPMRWLS